jgi:hypothetical protein
MSALTIRDEDYAATTRQQAMTPGDMLSMAVERGASIEVMTRLMDLRERWEAGQARKAFDEAVSAAKAEIPVIGKTSTGHNNKRYADFAAIARVVDPIITKHGLSYRFRTEQTDKISVTCVLSHRDGHSETNTLSGPSDTSGSKNAIQAIGSTLTYLQRYTLVQALGLAASEDDDGRSGNMGSAVSEDQIGELVELIESVGADKGAFLRFFKIEALADLPADKFKQAVAMLNAKRGRG